jgi:hypothetical protein
MKKTLIILMISALTHVGFGQSKSVADLYSQYKDHPDLFHLDLGGNFLGLAKSFNVNIDNEQANSLSKATEKVSMYKFPKSAKTGDFINLKRGLEKEKFELLLEAGKPSDGASIYGKGSKKINDLIIMVESDELIILELLGDFDPEMLSKLIN